LRPAMERRFVFLLRDEDLGIALDGLLYEFV
jgi:hypothetical protein